MLDERQNLFKDVQQEIKDMIFDYFNLISKEYEMSYEKCRSDEVYQQEIAAIKSQVDKDYVEKKWDELPASLTKDKARQIIGKKQAFVNTVLQAMIQGQQPGADGRVMIGQKELVYSLAKFDDDLFIQEGFRKEHVDKAIEIYELDKEEAQEDARLADFAATAPQRGATPAAFGGLPRETGRTINLD